MRVTTIEFCSATTSTRSDLTIDHLQRGFYHGFDGLQDFGRGQRRFASHSRGDRRKLLRFRGRDALDGWQIAQLAVDHDVASAGDTIRLWGWTNSVQPNLVQAQTITFTEGMGERIVDRGSAIKLDVRLPDGLDLADLDFSLVVLDGKGYIRAGFGTGGDAILLTDASNYRMLGNPPVPDYRFDVRFLNSTGAIIRNPDIVNPQLYHPGTLGDTSDNLLTGTSADDVFSGEGGTDTIPSGELRPQCRLQRHCTQSIFKPAGRIPDQAGGGDALANSRTLCRPAITALGVTSRIDGSDAIRGLYSYAAIGIEGSNGTIWRQEQFARHIVALAEDPLGTQARIPQANLAAEAESMAVEPGAGDDEWSSEPGGNSCSAGAMAMTSSTAGGSCWPTFIRLASST